MCGAGSGQVTWRRHRDQLLPAGHGVQRKAVCVGDNGVEEAEAVHSHFSDVRTCDLRVYCFGWSPWGWGAFRRLQGEGCG